MYKNVMLKSLIAGLLGGAGMSKQYKPLPTQIPTKSKRHKRDRTCKRFKSLNSRSNRRKARNGKY